MTIRCLRRPLLLLGVFLPMSLIGIRGAHAASSCPGDDNNDNRVTIDELVRAVGAALEGCPEPSEGSRLLQTGQAECDQGSGTLETCPGSPPGQDGAVRAGVPFSYTDNGDGTITDNVTGLMWEKLSDDGSIHDFDNTYTWYAAFNDKIAALNAANFAGHNDWRLPNRRELESLVHAGRVAGLNPAVDPAFDQCTQDCQATTTTCSCTQFGYYWSSTTSQDIQTLAWAVNFESSDVNAYDKGTEASVEYGVRAVRGGL